MKHLITAAILALTLGNPAQGGDTVLDNFESSPETVAVCLRSGDGWRITRAGQLFK